MAELEDREKKERELLALLLIIFSSDTIPLWIATDFDVETVEERMREAGVHEYLGDVTRRQTRAFLDEVEFDSDPGVLIDRMQRVADDQSFAIAQRMTARLQDWLVKRSVAEQLGEPLPEPDTIYTSSIAEREAITSLTQLVSDTEMMSRDQLWIEHGIIIQTFWTLDPRSNWCKLCLSLAGLNEDEWRRIYNGVPPAHPRCACSMSHYRVFSHIPTWRPTFTEPKEAKFFESPPYQVRL